MTFFIKWTAVLVCSLFMICPLHAEEKEGTKISMLTKKKVMVVRKPFSDYKKVYDNIKKEIINDYECLDFVIDKKTSYELFKKQVTSDKPALLILLDNQSIAFAQRYNKEPSAYAKGLQGVAAMGLNIDKVLKGDKNICGVSYEVPGFSIVTQFRSIIDMKIDRVMVFYRNSEHAEEMQTATKQLANEGVELVAIDVEADGLTQKSISRYVKKNLNKQIKANQIDAFWVLSDNGIINQSNFQKVWMKSSKSLQIPFLSGISSFVKPELGFCAFSSSPDHQELGIQVADMALSILEDKMSPGDIGVQYILSVKKTLNQKKIDQLQLKFKNANLKEVEVLK